MSLRRRKVSARGKCPIMSDTKYVSLFELTNKNNRENCESQNRQNHTNEPTKTRTCTMLLLGTLAGILHYYHVSTLFENDRHFSHLSNLEREMCFRSEMGLYYSFYKRIIYSQSFLDGVDTLTKDNLTEFPSTINALGKFNIYPEAMIAGLFRLYQHLLNFLDWTGRQCYTVHRGEGWPPVESCEGLGDPVLFYIEVVWIFAGFSAFLLFCYGMQLSGSVIGGCFTITCFFNNHAESTRVQWTPPLRESFAYPIVVLHLMMITTVMKNCRNQSQGRKLKWEDSMISFSTFISLLFWQFSQFILACEWGILIVLYAVGVIKRRIFVEILTCISFGYLAALVGLMGNSLLLCSFLTAILLSTWMLLTYDHKQTQLTFSWESILRILSVCVCAASLKYCFLSSGNDSHIVNIFLSKVVEGFNDFHTLMYTCSPEFQGLPWSYYVILSKSLLIPLLMVVLLISVFPQVCQIYSLLHSSRSHSSIAKSFVFSASLVKQNLGQIFMTLEPSLLFNFCLLIAFWVLSILAMRLKLFLTPQMCILVSLLASKQVIKSIPIVREKQSIGNFFLLLILIAVLLCGCDNIRQQHDIEGEYSNYPLEEVLTWVQMRTNRNDSFAGPMPIMASILLSTGRPIVNHPYYEDQDMRDRTILAYSVFSRKSTSEAFEAIQRLGANYVVLEANKCFDHLALRGGCTMTELWDLEDPINVGRPALCPQLFSGNASPFKRVFRNSEYVILYVSTEKNK